MGSDFRNKVLTNAGIIVGSFLVFGVVFYFLASTLQAKSAEVIRDRKVVNDRSYALLNLSDLKKEAPQAEEYKKKIEALLPNQDSLLGFPQFLDSLSRAHQVDLNFSFTGSTVPPAGDTAGSVGFTIALTGTMQNITDFIDDVEFHATRFLMGVDTVDIVPESQDYKATLHGRAFYR